MLVINYKGKTPQQSYYTYGVIDNNKSNKIMFIINAHQQDVDLSGLVPFLKLQNKGGEYFDKIELESVAGEYNTLEIEWELTRKSTAYRNLLVQLQFQSPDNREVVWQTVIAEIEFAETIPAEKEMEEKCPTAIQKMEIELADHEERIETLEGSTVDAYTKQETNELLAHKVDKEQGKGLSTNDFTDSYKEQIEVNTQKNSANNSKITIEKNGTKVDDFTLNQNQDKTINILVPTQASDVGALPNTTKYGASLSLNINSSTYVLTAQLKDQDGNSLGNAQTIDLPLESVVVSGTYDSQTKEVVLTLQNGSTIRFSVADLVSGLQTEITPQNKLDSDLVDDTNQTNKFVSQTEKDKLAGIEAGAQVNVQPDWNETDSAKDDYIKNKPDVYTKTEVDTLLAKKVGLVDLTVSALAPVGDSTVLTGITIVVKDINDVIIATETFNGSPLVFPLPLNQTYKVECLTKSTTIGGITYFAPEVDSGSAQGTLVQDESVVYRYSSTEHITTLSAVKQFLALPGIDLATKRLALVRTENNQFSVDIVIKNPANNTEYTMPLYILEVDNYTKLVEGVEQTFVGARVGFAYALPDSVPFDQREQVECASGETFQEGTYYYTATTTGIGDKAFTPLTAGTDYQNGDDIDTYKSTNNVFVFKHAWSNSQYGTGNKSTANLIRYGCNIFHKSNLFKWLNASGDDWFVTDHLGDTISGSWFEGKKGFKDWLKSTDLALIEQDVAYGVYEIDNATLPNNKVYAQFVVPSGTEIAGSVNNNEGTVFDYWKYLNGGVIGNSANANRTVVKVSNLTSKQNTWLRSPAHNYSYYAWRVNSDGYVSHSNAYYACAVLPLFTI